MNLQETAYAGAIGICVLLVISFVVLLVAFFRYKINTQKKLDNLQTENDRLKKEIDLANDSKLRFLAQTSHEIRTPLNIIMGMVQLALDEIDNREKMRDYLMKIQGSSEILLGIINDILDMSAIEEEEITLQEEMFDFKALITNLALMYYQQSQKKNIHFDVQLKGVTEDSLIGDSKRLNQVLENVVGNAVKFTASGGNIMMTVIQASTSRDRVHMRFIIKDTGCGMSKEAIERIFQPFEQVETDPAKRRGGSGLGLAISKNLISMMGGSIQVNSEEQKGTEFVIDIPFTRTKQNVKEKMTHEFASYRSLVVANDLEECRERGIVLEDMGLSYDTATDGEDALDMIGEAESNGNPYKLCVIDWRIKSIPGRELIHEIRNLFGDDMIIIGATYDLNESMVEGRVSGANYMVGKPVFRSTLFEALMRLSQGKIGSYDSLKPDVNYSFKGKRVLLAEDIAMNMEVAVKLLNKTGIEVVCTENGKEAFDLFEAKPEGYFDCIFLDINMPVMDGYEAARSIRSSRKKDAKTVPIYAMTANAFTDDVTNALNAGMNGHIAKPIETDVLYETLESLFCEE